MATLQWLHSGGSFNKEPDNDLGGYPSQFEISGVPPNIPEDNQNMMNNLFRDVMPDEADQGMIDYRCFYLWNNTIQQAITDLNISITSCEACDTTIQIGTPSMNEVQQIQINCVTSDPSLSNEPDMNGYVIFDFEFGNPFTITWKGDYTQFGTDLQTALQSFQWCSGITVTGSNPYIVTFAGDLAGRAVQPIRVLQNDLQNMGVARLDTVTYYSYDAWNSINSLMVKTVETISNYIPQTGNLSIYNPLTGNWDAYPYSAHDNNIFTLTTALKFNMVGFLGTAPPYGDVNDPDNWQRSNPNPESDSGTDQEPMTWGVVEAPMDTKVCQVCVMVTTEGGPIGSYAAQIGSGTSMPVGVTFSGNPLTIGNLRPNEGVFIWVERTTPLGADPCYRDYFTMSVSGTSVNWPLVPAS